MFFSVSFRFVVSGCSARLDGVVAPLDSPIGLVFFLTELAAALMIVALCLVIVNQTVWEKTIRLSRVRRPPAFGVGVLPLVTGRRWV